MAARVVVQVRALVRARSSSFFPFSQLLPAWRNESGTGKNCDGNQDLALPFCNVSSLLQIIMLVHYHVVPLHWSRAMRNESRNYWGL